MNTPTAVTQNAFKQAKKAAREAQAEYVAARREALALSKTANVIAREETIGRAIEARQWAQVCRCRVAEYIVRGVLPSGANYSLNAQVRLRACGRLTDAGIE